MANINQTRSDLMTLDDALGAAIVDYQSGMALGTIGGGVDLELAAAVIKAKFKTMSSLGISGDIEDILITLDTRLHIIRPSQYNPGLFLDLVLDKKGANLALARRTASDAEKNLEQV